MWTLLAKSTSLVGTLRKECQEMSPTAKLVKQRLYSTSFFKTFSYIMITFKSRKKELILFHPTVRIDDNEKMTPETVKFCNQTKYYKDIVDQMVICYTTKSGSHRWPIYVLDRPHIRLLMFQICLHWMLGFCI